MNRTTVQTAKEMARELRKRSTPAEEILWAEIRNRKFLGKKFLRQHPLFFKYIDKDAFFIADFYCHQNRLVIEIDGKSHDYQKEYDELRTHIINALGIRIVRFRNDESEQNLPKVLDRLRKNLREPM